MAEADGEELEEPDADDGNERPPIDDDERAELDLSDLADQVEESSGRSDDDDDDVDAGDQEAAEQLTTDSDSVGDKVVAIYALMLAGVARRYGEEEDVDLADKAEEIVDLAAFGPLDLSRDINRLLEQHGQATDIPPAAAVAIGAVALAAMVVLTETTLLEDLLEEGED